MVDIDSPPQGFSRRRLLAGLGVGAAAVAAPTLPLSSIASARGVTADATCSSDTDEQEVGPFYVADGLVRSDITSGEDGVPLTFTITVTDSESCAPLVGAAVDVWHASALGVYSDESSEDTVGDTYLRGIQITDSEGKVTFTSIYPGWYSGRTNHIHARVYTGGTVSGASYSYSDATLIWTGQMFFDPSINTAVAAVTPYSSNTVSRTTNAEDRVYTQQNGDEVLATTTGNTDDGYTSTVAYTVAAGSGSTGGSGKDTTTLSLTPSKSAVVFGQEVALSGALLDTAESNGLVGKVVTIVSKPASGKTTSATTTTRSGGAWSLRFTPKKDATYHARYAGSAGYAAARSPSSHVVVHERVRIIHVPGPAPARTPIVLTGKLAPARPGRRITIDQIVDGKRRAVAHTITNARGDWTARFHLSAGKHHLVATAKGDHNTASGSSRVVTVRRG
jgi:protocatechuate 3,4-dioxygenase beta subunit